MIFEREFAGARERNLRSQCTENLQSKIHPCLMHHNSTMTDKFSKKGTYMSTLVKIGDQLSVGAALLCGIHCFMTPIIFALLPSLKAYTILNSHNFHFWMLIAVLPTSLITLAMGCKKNQKNTFFIIGLVGLSILIFSTFWGHQLFGCKYEKYLTLLGSLIISFAHINNYLLCRKNKCNHIGFSC